MVVSLDWATGCVHLRGDLDRGAAHHLRDAFTALLATDRLGWTIDASDVTFCDAGGLRALTAAAREAAAAGRELRLGAAARCVTRLLALTGQTGLFTDAHPTPPTPAHRTRARARSRTGGGGSTTTPARHTVLR
ncbi:STAS domain-containing protein [Modestobacter sp. SYSU DS0511]